jgi:hypothetical protein
MVVPVHLYSRGRGGWLLCYSNTGRLLDGPTHPRRGGLGGDERELAHPTAPPGVSRLAAERSQGKWC